MELKKIIGFFISMILLGGSSAFANFSYEGFLTDSSGQDIVSQSAQIRLQISHPVSSACVLYDETHTVVTGSDGYFSLIVGAGTRNDGGSYSFSEIFQNSTALAGIACYTPAAGDERKMKIQVSVAGGTWDVLGTLVLHPSPSALVAENASLVGGIAASNLLKVQSSSAFSTPITGAQATDLLSLINGTSTKYLNANSSTAASLPSYSGSPSTPVAGSLWYDSTNGVVKYYNGSSSIALSAGSAGTVVNVAAGAGLLGGPITSSGTLSVDVGTTANKIVQLTAGGILPAVDGSLLTSLNPYNLAGAVPVSNGGTGATNFVANSLLMADGTGTAMTSGLTCAPYDTLKWNGTAWACSGAAFKITGGGVGIGTSSPAAGLDVATTFSVGASITGSPMTNMKICSATGVGGGAASTTSPLVFSISCAGAAVGSIVSCSPDANPGSTLSWSAWVSTAGTIDVKIVNTNASGGPTAANWKCLVVN